MSNPLVPTALQRRHTLTVRVSSSGYKIDYVIVIKIFLNPEGNQTPIWGSKVKAILLKEWILPIWSFIGKGLRLQPGQQACFICDQCYQWKSKCILINLWSPIYTQKLILTYPLLLHIFFLIMQILASNCFASKPACVKLWTFIKSELLMELPSDSPYYLFNKYSTKLKTKKP